MMDVKLISFTDDALNLLLRTKNTRLSHNENPAGWTDEKKDEHLTYMLGTIKSSWEMIDYTFEITGVTRAFTHELVRHRHGSFAQQSMRVVDVRNAPVITPASISGEDGVQSSDIALGAWHSTVNYVKQAYGLMIDEGIPMQDARGILPTNITTNIMAKFNLRSLHEMAKVRLCTRAAGEFQDVMRAMRNAVLFHHPWAGPFIQVECVSSGCCAFPRYGKTECPVYDPAMDHSVVKERARHKFWSLRYYAAPKAEGGMAMGKEEKA